MREWHIAVLIPARDEEALLPRCLASVQRARRLLPPSVSSDVIVVCDSSTDRTYRIAREMLGGHGYAREVSFGCVGAARIAAASAALQRCTTPPHRCWLANTDADCEVPAAWLLDQLTLAQRGVAAVAGIVDVDSFEEHQPHVRRRFRETYVIHPDGTHPHVHGANLGVRADAYLTAGGWAQLETAEDHDLWARLGDHGYARVSDARLQVTTSGRRMGRAPLGFAEALAAHNEVAV
jgi:glycosyltransferase involved in cell wall biosynthesis